MATAWIHVSPQSRLSEVAKSIRSVHPRDPDATIPTSVMGMARLEDPRLYQQCTFDVVVVVKSGTVASSHSPP